MAPRGRRTPGSRRGRACSASAVGERRDGHGVGQRAALDPGAQHLAQPRERTELEVREAVARVVALVGRRGQREVVGNRRAARTPSRSASHASSPSIHTVPSVPATPVIPAIGPHAAAVCCSTPSTPAPRSRTRTVNESSAAPLRSRHHRQRRADLGDLAEPHPDLVDDVRAGRAEPPAARAGVEPPRPAPRAAGSATSGTYCTSVTRRGVADRAVGDRAADRQHDRAPTGTRARPGA